MAIGTYADIASEEEVPDRKHPLGPDVVEECQAVAAIGDQIQEQEQWRPVFDPTHFTEQHGPLTLVDYKLTDEELKRWGERCTKLRKEINERVSEQELIQQSNERGDRRQQAYEGDARSNNPIRRSRVGMKRSMPSHNLEERTETDL